MYILGISAYFHDSAACLLKDDEIRAAAQEERFTRVKNDDSFPVNAVVWCLKSEGIQLADIDHVVFYEKPFLKFERLLETHLNFAPFGLKSFLKSLPLWLKDKLFIKKHIHDQLQEVDRLLQGNKQQGPNPQQRKNMLCYLPVIISRTPLLHSFLQHSAKR